MNEAIVWTMLVFLPFTRWRRWRSLHTPLKKSKISPAAVVPVTDGNCAATIPTREEFKGHGPAMVHSRQGQKFLYCAVLNETRSSQTQKCISALGTFPGHCHLGHMRSTLVQLQHAMRTAICCLWRLAT